MKLSILPVAIGGLISGCSLALTPQPSRLASGERIECTYVVPVGSHLKERVCMTVAEKARQTEQSKAVLAEAQQRLRDDLQANRVPARPARSP